MASLTTNPQTSGGGGNVSCDGRATSGFGVDMTAAHGITTGDGASTTGTIDFIRALQNGSGTYLGRLVFTFDTSSLTSGATISSATLRLYGNSTNFINQSSTSAAVVAYTGVSNNYQASDFGSFQYTALASPIALASLNQSGYNDFALNGTGLALVNKTGVTRLGVITEVDRAITTITAQDNIFNFVMADNGSNKPELVVTYTLLGSTGNFFQVF